MTITEKVAYLKGLIEGAEIDVTTKEGKILLAVMDVLSDVALSIEDLEATVTEMGEQVDTIDEDLDALETEFYDDEYDEDEDCCDCDCDCCDDEDFFEIKCPNCDEEFMVDGDTLYDGGIDCPNCGTPLEFEIDDCDGDECCCDECEDEE